MMFLKLLTSNVLQDLHIFSIGAPLKPPDFRIVQTSL